MNDDAAPLKPYVPRYAGGFWNSPTMVIVSAQVPLRLRPAS
ncbi:hypothetical protein [Streptomyces sp. NPDC051001]